MVSQTASSPSLLPTNLFRRTPGVACVSIRLDGEEEKGWLGTEREAGWERSGDGGKMLNKRSSASIAPCGCGLEVREGGACYNGVDVCVGQCRMFANNYA